MNQKLKHSKMEIRSLIYLIATSERWKDKESGEMKTNTEWHKIVIFNPCFS